MKIAPVDIRNQHFKKVVRGADPEEVRIFLAIVADEMEILINENRELEEKLTTLGVQVEEYRKVEMALRDTLLTAERLSSEAKDNSRKEAELILKDAVLKVDRILDEATRRACELRKEIVELKNQKDIYIARLRSLVETQLKMLRFHSVDLEEQEGAIAKLRQTQSLLGLDVQEPLGGKGPSETESLAEERPTMEPAADDLPEGGLHQRDSSKQREKIGSTSDGRPQRRPQPSEESGSEESQADSSGEVPYVEVHSTDEE